MSSCRFLQLTLWIAAVAPSMAQPRPADSVYFREVFTVEGRYVNDHSLIRVGDTWHLFYTDGAIAARPWHDPGNEIAIGHAASNDLRRWIAHEPALAIASSREMQRAHMYAPAVIAADDNYYLFYTLNVRGHGYGEAILTARSSNLFDWDTLNGVTFRPDTSWCEYVPATSQSHSMPLSCRDPFVMRGADGVYVLYYVARIKKKGDADVEQACVAAATSTDLVNWIDRGPVLTRAVVGYDGNKWSHPESPCVVVKDARYYLFWKEGDGTRYVISNDPLDFEANEIHYVSNSHASKVFEWRDRWYITSCSRAVDDVMHATSDRTRGLFVADLDWSGMLPMLTVAVARVNE